MRHVLVAALLVSCAAMFVTATSAQAKKRKSANSNNAQLSQHPKSNYYRGKGTQVRGFRRRGGYSYSYSDTINTYGDARTRYGSTNSYRDPQLGRQTSSGPFDNGFFFDSGVAPRGGNSPYLN